MPRVAICLSCLSCSTFPHLETVSSAIAHRSERCCVDCFCVGCYPDGACIRTADLLTAFHSKLGANCPLSPLSGLVSVGASKTPQDFSAQIVKAPKAIKIVKQINLHLCRVAIITSFLRYTLHPLFLLSFDMLNFRGFLLSH